MIRLLLALMVFVLPSTVLAGNISETFLPIQCEERFLVMPSGRMDTRSLSQCLGILHERINTLREGDKLQDTQWQLDDLRARVRILEDQIQRLQRELPAKRIKK